MKEFSYEFIAPIPEQANLHFETNGSQGGDSGHGGFAALTLSMPNGGNGLYVTVDQSNRSAITESGPRWMAYDEVDRVSIIVRGDFELEGLALSFLELGTELLARRDVMKDRTNWLEYDDLPDVDFEEELPSYAEANSKNNVSEEDSEKVSEEDGSGGWGYQWALKRVDESERVLEDMDKLAFPAHLRSSHRKVVLELKKIRTGLIEALEKYV